MCGIGFVINYDEKPINLDLVEFMFKNMEARGDDAAGIYYERPQENGSLLTRVYKAPLSPSVLWNSIQGKSKTLGIPDKVKNKWCLDGTETLIMMHSRSATSGTVSINENNMPIFSESWVLVHNGVVKAPMNPYFDYKGTVDSEHILAYLQTDPDITSAIGEISGSMAIAARELGTNNLYLYRNSNPLDIIIPTGEKTIWGCSRSEYIIDRDILKIVENDVNPFFSGYDIYALQSDTLYRMKTDRPSFEQVAGHNRSSFMGMDDREGVDGWNNIQG